MIELLKSHKVLICAGTGGVGKTSLSASLAVLAARQGLKVLVLTIDPAQRLAQSLGIEKRPGEEIAVEGVPGLSAIMIDARREFDEFVLGALDKGLAKQLFQNRLYQQLVSNLNGSQEFTSLVRLLNSVQSGGYDLVVLDTPPTQNAVDFLKAPERLYALFQDSVIGWFADPGREPSLIQRTLHRGTRLVTAALESVTGGTFLHELKDFFTHINHLKGRIARISQEVQTLLHEPNTGFLLITGFDETKLKEALEFQQDLTNERMQLCGVIVNRWFPEWEEGQKEWAADWTQNPDFQKLKEFYEKFSQFFADRQDAYQRFTQQLGKTVPVLRLPDYKNSVQGLGDLEVVARYLNEKGRSVFI